MKASILRNVLISFSYPKMDTWPTLRTHPSVWVKLTCPKCGRRGQYRLATLVERLGADCRMIKVLETLSHDCPYRFHHPVPMLPAGCQATFAAHPST